MGDSEQEVSYLWSLLAFWGSKLPGTLAPRFQAGWPRLAPDIRGAFAGNLDPKNFEAPWLPSCKQVGPNINPNVRGVSAGILGPKTSRHLGIPLPSGLAPKSPQH